jgi:hypothetical protein
MTQYSTPPFDLNGRLDKLHSVHPIPARHDAFHELIKQRHSKRRVAMVGTPHHSFGNELTARRSQGRHATMQLFGNVTGSMRTRTKLCHRTQIFFQPVSVDRIEREKNSHPGPRLPKSRRA